MSNQIVEQIQDSIKKNIKYVVLCDVISMFMIMNKQFSCRLTAHIAKAPKSVVSYEKLLKLFKMCLKWLWRSCTLYRSSTVFLR